MIAMSVNVTADQSQKVDLLNQFPQIIINKTTRDLHHSKRTISGLSNMADAQNIRIQLLKPLTQFVRRWSFKVRRERIAIRHR